MAKSHKFCRTPYGFQMSGYLQELVVFTGQGHVYEDSSEILEKLCGLIISGKQVERLSHAYGELLEGGHLEESQDIDQDFSLHYCMVDGGWF